MGEQKSAAVIVEVANRLERPNEDGAASASLSRFVELQK